MGGLAAEGFHRWGDVDSGVVLCSHDDKSTCWVVGAGRLLVGLDDIVVGQARGGQHV